jgi:hypothetical protein
MLLSFSQFDPWSERIRHLEVNTFSLDGVAEYDQRFNPQMPSTDSEMCTTIESQIVYGEQQKNL